eukprot:1805446-Rhodomonas_salina.2
MLLPGEEAELGKPAKVATIYRATPSLCDVRYWHNTDCHRARRSAVLGSGEGATALLRRV